MKESLRLILKMTDTEKARLALKKWRWRASHSRIESFKNLSAKIKRNEPCIPNTIALGLSNLKSMLDMIYRCCSSLVIPLPGRTYPKPEKVA